MIHVGNEVEPSNELGSEYFLQRKSLLDGELKYFLKHDIINADTQMQSLSEMGVDIEYGHLSDRKSIPALLKAGQSIRRICRKENIDLVHVLWGSTTALMTILFSLRPVIISFCGSDLLGNKDAKGNLTRSGKLNRTLSKFASRFAKHNITKSAQMKRFLPGKAQLYTTVIPNGVNLNGFYPMDINKARKNIGFDLFKKYVLFFYTEGQVVKNKKLALEVMDIVKNTLPGTELIIATKIPHEKLIYYYNACDVMILTSFHEGSNNSLKEANACNLPVVSLDIGDAKERLEDISNSFVIESPNPEPFAEKVVEVLRSQKRSDGEKASPEVSVESVARQVIQVYQKALKR
ncbi:MAG: hypothetical protein DHS20C18_24740 [Saprospiraceae bacterium]|nr:MAG: hypothetical protein DHS20C18_24740 [Saprospiraceae bacterium]